MTEYVFWRTPLISLTEIHDTFQGYFYDLKYNVFDFPPKHLERLAQELRKFASLKTVGALFIEKPADEFGVHIFEMVTTIKGDFEEESYTTRIRLFVRCVAALEQARPGIGEIVLDDIVKMTKEAYESPKRNKKRRGRKKRSSSGRD